MLEDIWRKRKSPSSLSWFRFSYCDRSRFPVREHCFQSHTDHHRSHSGRSRTPQLLQTSSPESQNHVVRSRFLLCLVQRACPAQTPRYNSPTDSTCSSFFLWLTPPRTFASSQLPSFPTQLLSTRLFAGIGLRHLVA